MDEGKAIYLMIAGSIYMIVKAFLSIYTGTPFYKIRDH